MECDNCGESVGMRKSLRRGKSATPEECPKCGEDLEPQSNTRLEK